MVVCSFYLRGACKFGKFCRNEHTKSAVAFGSTSSFGTPQPNDRYHYNAITNKCNSTSLFGSKSVTHEEAAYTQLVAKDLKDWDINNVWPLSCFAAQKEKPCFPGLIDTSPEELRVEAYKCQGGSLQPYLDGVKALTMKAFVRRNQLKALTTQELLEEIRAVASSQSNTTLNSLSAPTSGVMFTRSNDGSNGLFTTQNTVGLFGNSSQPSFGGGMQSTGLFGGDGNQVTSVLFGTTNQPSGHFGTTNQSTGLFSTLNNRAQVLFGSTSQQNSQTAIAKNPFLALTNSSLFSSSKNNQPDNNQLGNKLFSSLTAPDSNVALEDLAAGKHNAIDGRWQSHFGVQSEKITVANTTNSLANQTLAQTQNIASNPFLSQINVAKQKQFSHIYEQLRNYKSLSIATPLTRPLQITKEDIEQFQADRFVLGKIPFCAPPPDLC